MQFLLKDPGDGARRRVVWIVGALGLGIAGAVLYRELQLPLPWLLGPLLACLIAVSFRLPLEKPGVLAFLMRIVLGLAVGSAFTPELAARAGEMTLSLMFVLPYVLLIGLAGFWYFRVLAGFDARTAILAAAPGSVQTMIAIGEDIGADVRKLSIVHSTRILVIIVLMPFWLQWSGAGDSGAAAAAGPALWDLTLKDAALFTVCGLAGWWLARLAGISGASMIGPMFLSALIHVAGYQAAKMPVELVNAAQLVIGVHVGCLFAGITVREFFAAVLAAIGYALLLLLMAALIAVLVILVTGIAAPAVVLAYAPGGIPEMNIVALVLGIDPAYVALHHLLRVVVIIVAAQLFVRWFAGGTGECALISARSGKERGRK